MDKKRQHAYIIVEDEPLLRANIIKKVQSLNLPLIFAGEASDGNAAKALIDQKLPSIVLTDIRIPEGSGLELAEYVHDYYHKTKVIIISGYDNFSFAQSAIKHKVSDYLLKPVSVDALRDSLQRLLVSLQSEDSELTSSLAEPYSLSQEALCELMVQYLRENYQAKLSLSSLGEKLGYTSEYLSKLFKKHMGETPSKYLMKLRLNEARYLLVNRPDSEVHKIAKLVGYHDPFYFSRIFKSHVGVYPSDYRANPEKDYS